MNYKRMPIEIESPEQVGYNTIRYNLSESSVADMRIADLQLNINNLLLCYTNHIGKPELCSLIVKNEPNLHAHQVLITQSAATALFIVATAILNPQNHIVVLRPNYATNIETPKAIGCEITYIDLNFDEAFNLNIDNINLAIKPNTKLISITSPHNPTGMVLSENTLQQLAKIALDKKVYLLVDETYRELLLNSHTPLPYCANLNKQVISVASVSKAYGLPGIRIGWIITQNKTLLETFLAAKEQIMICNSVVDEEIAYQFLLQKNNFLPHIQQNIKTNFSVLTQFMQTHNTYFEWNKPQGGVVALIAIHRNLKVNLDGFYETLYKKYATFVGAGNWFELDKKFFRVGFGYPSPPEFEQGLQNVLLSLKENQIN